MAKLDEIKSEIDWLKDLFKILVAVLVGTIAGISKLYLDATINILFYLGIILSFGFTLWMAIIAKKIKNISNNWETYNGRNSNNYTSNSSS